MLCTHRFVFSLKDFHIVKAINRKYDPLIPKHCLIHLNQHKFFPALAELLVDKAMELRYVGGVYSGNIKPSPFLCLTLKMLQIQPEKDIVIEFIKNEDFK